MSKPYNKCRNANILLQKKRRKKEKKTVDLQHATPVILIKRFRKTSSRVRVFPLTFVSDSPLLRSFPSKVNWNRLTLLQGLRDLIWNPPYLRRDQRIMDKSQRQWHVRDQPKASNNYGQTSSLRPTHGALSDGERHFGASSPGTRMKFEESSPYFAESLVSEYRPGVGQVIFAGLMGTGLGRVDIAKHHYSFTVSCRWWNVNKVAGRRRQC